MGTYAYCLGEMDIPEEHRAEYARQVLEILRDPKRNTKAVPLPHELPIAKKPVRSVCGRFSAFDLVYFSFRSAAAAVGLRMHTI